MPNLPLAIFIGFLKETYIYQIGGIMLDRIIKNWKTTVAALVPAVVVIAGWWGFNVDPERLLIMAGAAYAIILLLSKDTPKEG